MGKEYGLQKRIPGAEEWEWVVESGLNWKCTSLSFAEEEKKFREKVLSPYEYRIVEREVSDWKPMP